MDSKTVFHLRNEAKELNGVDKLSKLNQALQIVNNLYQSEPSDEWISKAFSWILIDLCKYYISIKDLNQGAKYLQQLNSIKFDYPDEIIEKQKTILHPKIDANYADVERAEELSKSNKHIESLNIIQNLISKNRLNKIHHESYGWIIYRYIKNKENDLTSIQVRTFLRDYMNLNNERPSLLHSMILNFALRFSKEHHDLNLYNFFKLWNPKYLRSEDKTNQHYDNKEIPSLISRLLKEFVNSSYEYDIDYLLENIQLDDMVQFGYELNDELPF